ncbi:hypothetical protein [Streptomyces sp. RFCAC02]|uniref:hypothetical protein n=1 Tax=Streptomyces sp. RFCAC02 TaxID=2499143 RepID=UPI0010222D2C|nr:hypothetical protein [Streptomyces sp. RFCAC02]
MNAPTPASPPTAAPLPAVTPEVTAALVAALSPRLRKRLDAAAARIGARPVTRDGDTVRVAVDDEVTLTLHAPTGTVTAPEAIRCGCLLAPDCVHRAAVATAAPLAHDTAGPPADGGGADPAPADTAATAPEETATPAQAAAARALWDAGKAALEAGIDGAGAVLQAELLGAAHTARLAGLHRPATAAVTVVGRLRAARAGDPAHRLADLTTALRDLLLTAHGVPGARGAGLAALRGTARRPYTPKGSLRLYGLFTEPVVADTGHAGAVTWTADAEGRLFSVTDVLPGGPERAVAAAARTVRLGDTALTHAELSRAGLIVSGATVSPDARLGAGAAVRAARAAGAGWAAPPLDRLWSEPPSAQAGRALAALALPEGERPPGAGLLFLDATVLGPLRETGGDVLAVACGGLTVRAVPATGHPSLADRDNLRLLASAPGLGLRIIGRLVPADHPRLALLAFGVPPGGGTALRTPDPEARFNAGHDRLVRGDIPQTVPAAPPLATRSDRPPLHVLTRRTDQAVTAGRRTLALPGRDGADARALRAAGLATGALLLDELLDAATHRGRDVFGRLLPADADRFARAWLAAAAYADETSRALCAASWAEPA